MTPNDGKCHLTNGSYDASTRYDYPSLSFLRSKMSQAEILPIFATTGNNELYKVSDTLLFVMLCWPLCCVFSDVIVWSIPGSCNERILPSTVPCSCLLEKAQLRCNSVRSTAENFFSNCC